MRRTATLTALLAALLAIPAAASAHPGFNPRELPPGQPIESTLVVPHGCAPGGGMPEGDEGDAEPTVELALQHTDGVTVDPGDVDGWTVTDDGEAWVWSDDGGATTDVIEFPVTLTIDEGVAAGDELYLKAFQECADGSAFQWIGTPDEEASFPAARLTATDSEVGSSEPDESMTTDHGEMDMDEDMAADEDAVAEQDAETEQDPAAEEEAAADDDAAVDTDEPDTEETAATEDGGLSPVLVVVVILALVAAAGAAVALRRRSA